jgi:glycosyltransferase involved in cell wall biosynthesis
VIVNGRTGITVPAGDSRALSEAICMLLRSQTLRDRLAEEGRAWVLEHFTQERQVRQTGELYLEALGQTKVSDTCAERRQAVAQ